ncbi:xanthine permease [Porphyromonas gingivalis]|nr:xanthine permease [Porphyromonas gingivalis]
MAIAPNEATPQVDLIYKIEDKPSFKDAVFAAFQHLLAIFVAIITPPLIIAGALNLDLETTSFLVSMALFASGVSTFIQCRRVGPLGAGLLCVQGTSFSFIGPIISAGLAGGLPLIFGCTIAAAPVEMIVSRTFRYLKQIITPLVSGIVVLLIGLSLIKVGIISCGGGNAAMSDGTFGNWQNLSIAALVLVSVLFFNKSKNKYIRMSSIVLGLLVGYVLAYILGRVDLSGMETTKIALLNIPVPFKYGLSLNLSSFIAIGLIYLITAIEATGDITANSMISGEPVEGDKYIKRVSGRSIGRWLQFAPRRRVQFVPQFYLRPKQRVDPAHGCGQSSSGLLYCGYAHCAWLVPGYRPHLFSDARSRIRRSYAADVRNCSRSRYTHHCSSGYRPEGYDDFGHQFVTGLGCRVDAGHLAQHIS